MSKTSIFMETYLTITFKISAALVPKIFTCLKNCNNKKLGRSAKLFIDVSEMAVSDDNLNVSENNSKCASNETSSQTQQSSVPKNIS